MDEGQYLVGLPVGVAIGADGSVELTVYAEDLTSALRKDEDAPAEHVEAASRFLDAGTALSATHVVVDRTAHPPCNDPGCPQHGIAASNARQSAFYAANDRTIDARPDDEEEGW